MKNESYQFSNHNRVELLLDGEDYNKRYLELIHSAEECIHLQVYIFKLDSFGKLVFEALLHARKREVKVYLLVDAVGSSDLKYADIEKLQKAGVYFCYFNGIVIERLARWGRRLHHKALIIDQQRAVVGGINIVSPYTDGKFSSPTLDFALYLEGPVTLDITDHCEKLFVENYGDLQFYQRKWPIHHDKGYPAMLSVNDWMHRRIEIANEYEEVVEKSTDSIIIVNSYFFPRPKFMKKLAQAAARGVKVRLILAKYSDWPSWILASEYLYYFFLKNNIEIYLWEKSILHGKLACVDGKWSTIGSFNLNYTSYQGNLEMNIDLRSEEFTSSVEKLIDELIDEGCERVTEQNFNTPMGLPKRFFYYVLLGIISNFSLAFVFQEDEEEKDVHRFKVLGQLLIAVFCILFGLIGLVVPGIVGIPFLVFGIFLISKHILLNKSKSS